MVKTGYTHIILVDGSRLFWASCDLVTFIFLYVLGKA